MLVIKNQPKRAADDYGANQEFPFPSQVSYNAETTVFFNCRFWLIN